jgi:tetratricopeptide (TPR) repeat protein
MYLAKAAKSRFRTCVLLVLITIAAAAQSKNTPVFDPAIPFSSFIREDLFAGFLWGEKDGNDRFLRGERNLEILLTERPQDRPGLLAWKAGTALKRAIDALQLSRQEEFEREYRKAMKLYADAAKLAPNDPGVMAISGAGIALFADQLPERYRNPAWEASYKLYMGLWQMQAAKMEELPVHFRGELLAGVAQAAQRTGRAAKAANFLERIIKTLPGTPYATAAKKWIDSPGQVGETKLVCQTCHEAGRLEARKLALAARDR